MAAQANGAAEKAPYILYHNPYSICSLMVRYTLAVRGSPGSDATAMEVEEKELDIFHEAQLDEKFLCEVNALGQVPVLVNPSVLSAPMPDSLQITWYLAERYPSLLPTENKEKTVQLLRDLHALNYFSLSFPGRPQVAAGFKTAIEKRLDTPGISQQYRDALEYKMTILKRDKIGGLVPAKVEEMKDRARSLLSGFEQLLVPDQGPWLYGASVPSALDAHLVTFIARMRDVGREELIPERMGQYGDKAMQTQEWRGVMQGRATMYPGGKP